MGGSVPFFLLWILLLSPSAAATSCTPSITSAEGRRAEADLVFLGTVVPVGQLPRVGCHPTLAGIRGGRVVAFDVAEVFKGHTDRRTYVTDHWLAGTNFRAGRTYFVYARGVDNQVGLCDLRSSELEHADRTELSWVGTGYAPGRLGYLCFVLLLALVWPPFLTVMMRAHSDPKA